MNKPAGVRDDSMPELFEEPRRLADPAARKRAAIEMIARHERALRNTARRYSLCGDDADDAFQRTLEIVLTKAPTDNQRELIRWTHTVMKHEALAVRRNRERLLGTVAPPSGEDEDLDWVTLIPAQEDGPDLRVERRERVARSREALQALKPAELRALTLLAEGYSYAEISEITGFTRTKVNRSLAEGRERFRLLVSRTEDGSRCEEMLPLLSAYCDGEAGPKDAAVVREHLRACAHCRGAMRSYRAAPPAAAAIAPLLPLSHSLLDRLRDAVSHLTGGGGGHAAATAGPVAGSGAGLVGAVKVAAVCAGVAGGAAAGVAAGVVPSPWDRVASDARPPAMERTYPNVTTVGASESSPRPKPHQSSRSDREKKGKKKIGQGRPATPAPPVEEPAPPIEEPPVEATEAPMEYAAPPAPPPEASSEPSGSSSESGAGEFGP